MESDAIRRFDLTVRKELDENIIRFWVSRGPDKRGGFIGRMTNEGAVVENAPKGLILNARILWTFSALYSFDKKQEYKDLAQRAYDYLMQRFWDDKHGGLFWTVDWQGRPLDDKKRTYGQAFMIYALAEYIAAFASQQAMDWVKNLLALVDKHARDRTYGGYVETFTRDWSIAQDQRLSKVDMDEKKSMNTHLHMLEGLTNVYRVWKDALVTERLKELTDIFLNRIIRPDRFCCRLFFDERWQPRGDRISFGHDIEASWLLCRAAKVLHDSQLLDKAKAISLKMAESVYAHGLDEGHSVFYEGDSAGITDSDKHWWVQAEAVVGFLNAYELSGRQTFLDAAWNIWKFIENHLIDRQNGEWFYKVSSKGQVDGNSFKVSEWKCPYHNTRTCIEIIERLGNIARKESGALGCPP